MWRSLLAIAIGAVGGAWLRWGLGIALNAAFPTVPPGTLTANLLGGLIIGAALQLFAVNTDLGPEWRLLVVTGFCGGLTTFSTFSAELVTLLQAGRYAWVGGHIALHVIGSALSTLAGMAGVQGLRSMNG